MADEATAGGPAGRSRFLASLGFPLDAFQAEALDALDQGRSVLVAAPTGSGKTVVAEYALALALAGGGKAFYTTPLKALSNQKYADLCRRHGSGAVGLLTGDNAVNGDADLVVMTTEVLRNMIYAGSPALARLRWVILDEVHYLQNPYRGAVWEEVIIHAPPAAGLVCLSATISNAEEVAEWIGTVRGDTAAVVEEHRPVELHHLYAVGDRRSPRLHLVPTFVDGRPNPEAAALDSARVRPPGPPGRSRSRLRTPYRSEVVEALGDAGMLPGIYFIFSRAACDDAVRQCLADGMALTTTGERDQIRAVAGARVAALADDDLDVLGYGEWMAGLEAGLAAHHAGLVPPFKEAVEACFSAGLVKVVFATETLSLGINMPARSVVIEKLSKFTGERHEMLTAGEYTQLTGRAGRRGIDEVGYAVVLWSPFVPFGQVAGLASTRTYALRSSFRPTYNMAANLVRRYPAARAHHLLNLSFAQFETDAEVVRLEAARERLNRAEAEARAGLGGSGGGARAGAGTRGAKRAERLRREARRLERRVRAANQSLSRQLDRVLALLERWGYVSGWSLTPSGQRLVRIYHELDLLVAQVLEEGLLDGLAPPAVAGLVSVFTYEARGPVPASLAFPDGELRRRWLGVETVAARLARAEASAGLPPSRTPDPGFLAAAHAWAAGSDLQAVVGQGLASGGDFVRNVKQLVDLLAQLGQVAPQPETAAAARRAADAVFRGVVAASSLLDPPGPAVESPVGEPAVGPG